MEAEYEENSTSVDAPSVSTEESNDKEDSTVPLYIVIASPSETELPNEKSNTDCSPNKDSVKFSEDSKDFDTDKDRPGTPENTPSCEMESVNTDSNGTTEANIVKQADGPDLITVADKKLDVLNNSILQSPKSDSGSTHKTKISRELKGLQKAAAESKIITEFTNITEKMRSRKTLNSPNTNRAAESGRKSADILKLSETGRAGTAESLNGAKKDNDDEKTPKSSKTKQAGKTLSEQKRTSRSQNLFDTKSDSVNKSDIFCWQCHKDTVNISCKTCPRSFHTRCVKGFTGEKLEDWYCPECLAIIQAETTDTRSHAMKQMTLSHLCELLKFALQRMTDYVGHSVQAEPFLNPVDVVEFPDYTKYVVHPMDLSQLEHNIKKNLYGSTEAFIADTKWILHNSVIYNSCHTKVTSVAKGIIKICKQEMSEIETCPECYLKANTNSDTNWFLEVCSQPHMLVWAKLKGYPYWPAKAMTVTSNGLVDVRFFGAHDKAWIPAKDCLLYSEKDPNFSDKGKRADYVESVKELGIYIKNLEKKFGKFHYAPFKTPYPMDQAVIYSTMLPSYKYKPVEKPIKVVLKNSSQNKSKPNHGNKIPKTEHVTTNDNNTVTTKHVITKESVNVNNEDSMLDGYGTEDDELPNLSDSKDQKNDSSENDISLNSTTQSPSLKISPLRGSSVRMRGGKTNSTGKIKIMKIYKTTAEDDDSNTTNESVSSNNSADIPKLSPQNVLPKSIEISVLNRGAAAVAIKRRNSDSNDNNSEEAAADEKKSKIIEDAKIDKLQIVNVTPIVQNSKQTTVTEVTENSKKSESTSLNSAVTLTSSSAKTKADESVKGAVTEVADKKDAVNLVKTSTVTSATTVRSFKIMDKLLPQISIIGVPKSMTTAHKAMSAADSAEAVKKTANSVKTVTVKSSDVVTATRVPDRKMNTVILRKRSHARADLSGDNLMNTSAESNKSDNLNKSATNVTSDQVKRPKRHVVNQNNSKETSSASAQEKNSVEKSLNKQNTITKVITSTTVIDTKTKSSTPSRTSEVNKKNDSTMIVPHDALIPDVEIKTEPLDEDDMVADTTSATTNTNSSEQSRTSGHQSATTMSPRGGHMITEISAAMNNKKQSARKSFPNRVSHSNINNSKNMISTSTPQPILRKVYQKNTVRNNSNIVPNPMVYIPHSNVTTSKITNLKKSNVASSTSATVGTVAANNSTSHVNITNAAASSNFSSANGCGQQDLTNSSIVPLNYQLPLAGVGTFTTSRSCDVTMTTTKNSLSTAMTCKEATNGVLVGAGGGSNAEPQIRVIAATPMDQSQSQSSMHQNRTLLGPLTTPMSVHFPSECGPVTKLLNENAHKLSDYFRSLLQETLVDFSNVGSADALVRKLQAEVESLKWLHKQELSELKHNTELIMWEMRSSFELANSRNLAEFRKQAEAERVRCVQEAKSKQWCVNCGKEAQFYCCWNTSYCDYDCQRQHWSSHMTLCGQHKQESSSASSPSHINDVKIKMKHKDMINRTTGQTLKGTPKLKQNIHLIQSKNSNPSGKMTFVQSGQRQFELVNAGGASSGTKIVANQNSLLSFKNKNMINNASNTT